MSPDKEVKTIAIPHYLRFDDIDHFTNPIHNMHRRAGSHLEFLVVFLDFAGRGIPSLLMELGNASGRSTESKMRAST
jgi:hypothetical protein